MAISRLSDASIQDGLPKFDNLWDGKTATSSMDSLGVVVVGSATASSITFSSIPSTYTHLQVRWIGRGTFNESSAGQKVNFNSDAGSNYSGHLIRGDGASVFADGGASATSAAFFGRVAAATATAGMFGAFVMDILDYANTNKYKTLKCIGGSDRNGSGEIRFNSNVWMSTTAISSMTFAITDGGNYAQHTQFALYGIK
jgi:hypothetical protein